MTHRGQPASCDYHQRQAAHYLPTQLITFGMALSLASGHLPLYFPLQDVTRRHTLPAKKLRQVSSTVISLASLLCGQIFQPVLWVHSYPPPLPNARNISQDTLAVQGSTDRAGVGKGGNSERPQWAPTSLCSLCRQSSSVSSISLSAKENTHTLRKSPLQTRS